jgi:serine/threonine-protein kinase
VAEPHSLHDERTWLGSTGATHAGSRGLRPELVVSGRYRIGSLIGAGGMGLVYEAEHLGLGLQVALKVLRPELLDDDRMIALLQQEARCMARLRGEHMVRVLDEGRLETGLPFFVMERLHGLDLRAVLQSCSSLPVVLTVDYARQVCAALTEAHAAGIIHRDIKPSNLFVTPHASGRSRLKLIDFGIAQRGGTWTRSEPLGTTAYASPEQIETPDRLDERSDIWSLGVVVFEALTGSLPVTTGLFGQRRLDLRPLERRSDVPDALRSIIRRCLAEDKGARFGSAATLDRALAPFAVPQRHASPAPARTLRQRPWAAESRARRSALRPRASLWSRMSALQALPPPRRASPRTRPIPNGSLRRT